MTQSFICPSSHAKHLFFFFFSFWPHCMACKIWVPWLRIEPVPPTVEVHSSNHWTAREFLSQSLFKLQNMNYNGKNVSLLNLSHQNLLSPKVCCSPSSFTTTILFFGVEHLKTTNIQDHSAHKKEGHICEIHKGTSSTFYRVARGV